MNLSDLAPLSFESVLLAGRVVIFPDIFLKFFPWQSG